MGLEPVCSNGASVDLAAAAGRDCDLEVDRVRDVAAVAEERDLGMVGVGGRRADVSADEIRAINVALGYQSSVYPVSSLYPS